MCSSVPTPPYLLCACMDLRRLTCCLLVHLSASSQPTVATGWRDYNKTGVSCLTPSLPCLQGRLKVAEGGCVFRLCAMCACSSINNTLLSPMFSSRKKKCSLLSLIPEATVPWSSSPWSSSLQTPCFLPLLTPRASRTKIQHHSPDRSLQPVSSVTDASSGLWSCAAFYLWLCLHKGIQF